MLLIVSKENTAVVVGIYVMFFLCIYIFLILLLCVTSFALYMVLLYTVCSRLIGVFFFCETPLPGIFCIYIPTLYLTFLVSYILRETESFNLLFILSTKYILRAIKGI